MSNKDISDKKYHSGKAGEEKHSLGHSHPHATPDPMLGYEPEPEDEIDLAELAGRLWKDRILIAKIVGIFVLAGLFIAIFSSVEYEVNTVLLPEVQSSQSRASNLLKQYGGLLGIGGGGSGVSQNGTIPPQIYPKIIESAPYQLELIDKKIYFSEYDTTVTLQTFFQQIYEPSVLSTIEGYTFGLPGKIIHPFKGGGEAQNNLRETPAKRDSVYSIAPAQWSAINQLRSRMNVITDNQTSLITFTFKMPTPYSTANVANAALL